MSNSNPAKVFISYKSENAQLVRQVVEELMYHGIRTWFAEYDLLSKDHIRLEDLYKRLRDEIGNEKAEQAYREQIRQVLSTAMSDCTHGVAFTNQFWAGSDFCKHEINYLIEKFGNRTSRVLQICLPNEPLDK